MRELLCTSALCIGLLTGHLAAQDSRGVTVRGPVLVGNGLGDGPGATLGRLFLLLSRSQLFPEEDGGPPVPLELLLTSSFVTVDPTTCSRLSVQPCSARGNGIAGAAGFPTEVIGGAGGVMVLKLSSAFYLAPSDRYQNGSSLEVALEGSLYADPTSEAGAPADLLLNVPNPAYLLAWGADEDRPAGERRYHRNTGAAVLLGDSYHFPFPGWFRGRVVENNGFTLLVEFSTAEISKIEVREESRVWVEPDPARAREAGFPEGVFFQLEVNYSSLGTLSRIVPGAASNDVELTVTAAPMREAFLRGDCNGDGMVTGALTDAIILLRYNFQGGRRPPCLVACDADGDGKAEGLVADAVYLLRFMFFGDAPPPEPYPFCGVDKSPAPDNLGCENPTCL